MRRHKHCYRSYTLEKNVREGFKLQVTFCDCGLRFCREVYFRPTCKVK